MKGQRRGRWLNLARVVISLGLLTWVLSRAGVGALIDLARGARLGLLSMAIGLMVLGVVVRAYRWRLLLGAVGARPPFGRLVYLYFVGSFFNAFLPTGFGGDVVRVLEAGEGLRSEQAAGTVLVDRLSGFIGLFGLALAALPFAHGLAPAQTMWLIGGLAVAVVGGSALLFEGRALRRLTAVLPRPLSLASGGWLARAYDVIVACGARAILGALAVSTLFNAIQIAANVLLARSLGISISAWYFVLFIPVATIALLTPTISGLGVRETIYVSLFAQPAVGLDPVYAVTQATALSLGAWLMEIANGLTGGVLYIVRGAFGLRATGGPPA